MIFWMSWISGMLLRGCRPRPGGGRALTSRSAAAQRACVGRGGQVLVQGQGHAVLPSSSPRDALDGDRSLTQVSLTASVRSG